MWFDAVVRKSVVEVGIEVLVGIGVEEVIGNSVVIFVVCNCVVDVVVCTGVVEVGIWVLVGNLVVEVIGNSSGCLCRW